jgi:hypothetical protein
MIRCWLKTAPGAGETRSPDVLPTG